MDIRSESLSEDRMVFSCCYVGSEQVSENILDNLVGKIRKWK